MILKVALTISIFFVLIFYSVANAGWELYDDFESGTINTEKWSIDNSSADIEIENGRAKFTHKAGTEYKNDSSWLGIKRDWYDIFGIKAKITVDSCTGDVKGRIGADFAISSENSSFAIISLRADRQRIDSSVSIEDFSNNYLYDAFWSGFKNPININQTPYIVGTIFSNNKFTFFAEGFGKIIDTMPGKWFLVDHYVPGSGMKGIGTRSSNGDGPCVVYFDDIYVLKSKSVSPSLPLLLLDDN